MLSLSHLIIVTIIFTVANVCAAVLDVEKPKLSRMLVSGVGTLLSVFWMYYYIIL